MPDLKKLITLEALQAALPSWLKSSSKPSYTADEISDTNTTNKFVTSADKSTWNAKGTYSKPTGGIPKSDLSQLVQDSLDLADSALQSESDPTVPSWAKQTNKPSYTQDEVTDGTTYKRVTSTEKSTWNNKQSALTTTQMSAVNSGIDSTKVGQISTNQSNIWYAIDTGVKNWFVVPDGTYSSKSAANSSVCSVENGVVKIITCSTADTRVMTLGTITLPAGTYKLSNYILGGSPNYGDVRLMNPDGSRLSPTGDGVFTIAAETIATVKVYTWSASALNASVSPFLCVKSIYDQDTSYQPPALPNYDLTRGLAELNAHPFYQVPINHNMIYRGRNLGATLTDAQHTSLSSGNFTDLYLGDYWTKTVTIPAGTYTGGDGGEVTVPAQTVTLKAIIADFDTFYAGYASDYAAINTHHAAVIVTGFNNVVWNKTNTTAGGYVNSLIHKWLVGSVLPEMETWFGSAKVLSHQKLLTNAITGDAASGWAWSSQKISLLSENQVYGSKVWGNSKAANSGYEPGEAFKHLNVFNHIDANLLFGNKNIWLRDIASAGGAAYLSNCGYANRNDASATWLAPAALILLS